MGKHDDLIIQSYPKFYDPQRDAGDCWFDEGEAESVVAFFENQLTHIEGSCAGKPFHLEPWESAIVRNIFGWKKADGTRRYRTVFIYVPRKNGKTPLSAGIGNCILFGDPEPSQQDYIAAGDREQASLLFRHAAGQVRANKLLKRKSRIYGGLGHKTITRESLGSFLKVIAPESETKYGQNPHLLIVDELHVQPNRDLLEVFRTSMVSSVRKQPLMILITTADWDHPSVCNEEYDYACKVRDGIVTDASYLPIIYEARKEDDWHSEEVWARVNPNLGVSVSLEALRELHKRACEEPAFENEFKRQHLNLRTEQATRLIPMDDWDQCGQPFLPEQLKGEKCWIGLDLGRTLDWTAAVFYFPASKILLPHFWIPDADILERERMERVPIRAWADAGLVHLCPGRMMDYEYIREAFKTFRIDYRIMGIGYDPAYALELVTGLGKYDGFRMIEFRQGYMTMAGPVKHFLNLIKAHELKHGGNPVLRWQANNVMAVSDHAGNIKLTKGKSAQRIDGIVAAVMAVGLPLFTKDELPVYSGTGVLWV